MSSPRDPDSDLSLERLGDRNSLRLPPLGETALVLQTSTPADTREDLQAALEALNNAAFTAPGAAEWLAALRRAVAALLGENKAPRRPAAHTAVRPADPGRGEV
jgi:hypothetical protein